MGAADGKIYVYRYTDGDGTDHRFCIRIQATYSELLGGSDVGSSLNDKGSLLFPHP